MKLNHLNHLQSNPHYRYPLISTSQVHFQAYFSSSTPSFLYLETASWPFLASEKPPFDTSLQGSSSQMSRDSSNMIPVDNVPKKTYLSTPEPLLCQKTVKNVLFQGRPPGFIFYPGRPPGFIFYRRDVLTDRNHLLLKDNEQFLYYAKKLLKIFFLDKLSTYQPQNHYYATDLLKTFFFQEDHRDVLAYIYGT